MLGSLLTPGSVVALTGPLGSGKTTFVKGIARSLGITEDITSPTFTIISEYEGRLPLFHMDLYRISGEEELEDTGGVELMSGNGISVIEWAENAEETLPEDTIHVTFEIIGGEERKILIRGIKQ